MLLRFCPAAPNAISRCPFASVQSRLKKISAQIDHFPRGSQLKKSSYTLTKIPKKSPKIPRKVPKSPKKTPKIPKKVPRTQQNIPKSPKKSKNPQKNPKIPKKVQKSDTEKNQKI